MIKEEELKCIKQNMVRAKKKIEEAKAVMVDNKFQFEDIRFYNAELSNLSSLRRDYEIKSRINKPQVYMETVSIPGNIYK